MRLSLYDLAHSRAGDKGNLCTLSLIPYDRRRYELLKRTVTAERVGEHLRDRVVGPVVRHCLPNISTLIFVCPRQSFDNVTTSLHLDGHGKTISSALLELVIDVPDDVSPSLEVDTLADDERVERGRTQ